VDWKILIGAGCLAGIGFTMSLFITSLALPADLLDAGKIGTLLGSTVSAIIGSMLLAWYLPGRKRRQVNADALVLAAKCTPGFSLPRPKINRPFLLPRKPSVNDGANLTD